MKLRLSEEFCAKEHQRVGLKDHCEDGSLGAIKEF